jgi:osmotically-inducible protein OsmY
MTQMLHPTAHQLKSRIVDELGWTPEVDAAQIGVAVTDGAVTLSGEVSDYHQKTAAVRAVLRLSGVNAVADEIVVRHPSGPRPDVDIARDAGEALFRTRGAAKVGAEVMDHIVTLTGETAWHFQRLAAARAVEAVDGVTDVRNRVTIVPSQTFSTGEAAARITAALERNAGIDARNVHVRAQGSTVELTGQVTSWAEQRQAGHAAYSTPGVTAVRNLLRVTA